MHNNPAEAGLVYKAEDAEDYVYSCASDYVGKKELLDDILMYQYDAELKTNSKRYAML
ncbi:MAG: hypothetical protein GX163_02405 [Bacteroidetes bacterium]|jgi:hypothetical protein|nr:hypothetical protein [Bacteroidota bacterium]